MVTWACHWGSTTVVAVASAIPNMSVIAPCDPAETRLATQWCVKQERGPVYLRLAKAGEPDLSSGAPDAFEFGKLRFLRRGGDLCILGYGPTLKLAVRIAEQQDQRGVSTSVVSVHTLKPLDEAGLAAVLASHKHVAVLEEMAPRGGLGDAVKRIAWDTQARCRIDCFSLKDEFIHLYGKHEELLAAHGFSPEAILRKMES